MSPEKNQKHRHTNGGATVGTKRQRRPSVRLGDLGGGNLISTYYYDHLLPRQRPRKQPLKVTKEAIIDAENGVDNDDNNGSRVSKSKKGLKKGSGGSGNEENVENVGDLDGVAIGSWKARVLASRGGGNGKRGNVNKLGEGIVENEGDLDGSWKGRGSGSRGGKMGSNGRRGGVSNVGSKLVDENRNESGNEDDLDGVAIGRWKGRALGARGGSNGRRGDRSNVGSKVVREDRNESGDGDGDRNFEPICSEEEDIEENHDDSSPVRSFDKDNSDGGDGDGNENINGGGGENDGVEKGRNDKDLRFQVSDEMDDPSDLSEKNGVKVWLKKLGLERYAHNFEIHMVDDEVLPLLTFEDLKDMGITAVGSRRKMFCSIQNLNKGFC